MEFVRINADIFDSYYNEISKLLEISASVSLPDDAPICNYIDRKLKEMRQYIQGADTISFLACLNGKAVGFIWCHEIVRFGIKRLHVAQFAVNSEFRGQGIGKKLIREAEEYAEQEGYSAVELFVTNSNDAALHVYESEGFMTEKYLMCKEING